MPDAAMEPFALAPGEGLSVENPVGGRLTFKTTAKGSGGALTAIETIAAPREGPPLHVHPDRDETIYVLDGRFRVKLADDVIEAPPGSFVFIPRGTPHTWQNLSDAPARFFATVMPADVRFEQFFVSYSQLPDHERGADAFARLAQETRAFEVLGPPLADLPHLELDTVRWRIGKTKSSFFGHAAVGGAIESAGFRSARTHSSAPTGSRCRISGHGSSCSHAKRSIPTREICRPSQAGRALRRGIGAGRSSEA